MSRLLTFVFCGPLPPTSCIGMDSSQAGPASDAPEVLPANTLNAEEQKAGRQFLFFGQSMTNWRHSHYDTHMGRQNLV